MRHGVDFDVRVADIVGDGKVRESAVFRHVVRCDRATNKAIERAAAKAGQSVACFVQAHFETILREREASPAGAALPETASADMAAAKGMGISLLCYRVLRYLSSLSPSNGTVTASYRQIAAAIDAETPSVAVFVDRLLKKGMIERVNRPGFGRNTGSYRVIRMVEP